MLLVSALLLTPALPAPKAAAATLDVTSYGANGGDSNDDRAAIQGAIDAAAAGDTVYFPAGTYYISNSLIGKSDVKLQGASRDTAIIKAATGSASLFTGVKAEATMFNLGSKSNVEVSGITFDGNSNSAVSSAIWGETGSGHKIHHIRIKDITQSTGFGPFGILFSGTPNTEITDNEITNIGVSSIWGGAIRTGWGSTNAKILRNTIHGTGRVGIFVNDNSPGAVIRENVISGSSDYVQDYGFGIEIHTNSGNAIVEDNVMDHWLSVVRSEYTAIRRNYVGTNNGTYKSYGLEVSAAPTVVTDNIVDGGQHLGMSMSPANGHHIWAYNTVQNMIQWGVQIHGADPNTILNQYLYFYKNIWKKTDKDNPASRYADSAGHGIRINGKTVDTTFDSNQILDNDRLGIQITGAAGVDRLSFVNNTITGNGTLSTDAYPAAALDLEWSGNTVSGNGTDRQLTSRGFSNVKPVADFVPSATFLSLGQPVTFTNTSADPDGSIVHYLWELGEGLPVTTASPTYTYQKAGTYKVMLLVTDNGGRQHLKEQTIIVDPGPPDTQPPTAPTGLTSPSKTDVAVTLAWTASTDNKGVAEYEVYRGGSTLCGKTTGTSLTCMGLSANTTYSFTVKAKDQTGNVSAASAPLSVNTLPPDTQAPSVPTGLALVSKAITTATLSWNASTDHFGVTGYELYRDGVLCVSGTSLTMACPGLNASQAYSFTVKAKDAAGNVSGASAPVSVTTNGLVTGSIEREYWTGIPGTFIASIPVNQTPTGTSTLTTLEGPSNFGDSYGTRIRGFLTPTVSGAYTFRLSGDDDSELWLGTGSNPASKVKIASLTGYTGKYEWTKFPSQTSAAASLTAGVQYYIEVLHKENVGGDHIAVAWTGPGITTVTVIPGSYLTPFNAVGNTGGGSPDTQAPSVPTGLISPSQTTTTVDLSWTSSTDNVGVAGYDILRGGTLAGSTSGAGAVTFQDTGLTPGTAYSYTVRAKDAAGNVSAASSALTVTTSSGSTGGGTGTIVREYWTGVSGDTIANVPVASTPTGTDILTSLEGPKDWGNGYATRIRGYITPAVSGTYTFWIASDNAGELWLSTNDNPANKTRIAYVSGWTGYRQWTAGANQQSAGMALTAGQRYYVEVLHKEASSSDHVSVGWAGPGISAVTVIDGSYLSPY